MRPQCWRSVRHLPWTPNRPHTSGCLALQQDTSWQISARASADSDWKLPNHLRMCNSFALGMYSIFKSSWKIHYCREVSQFLRIFVNIMSIMVYNVGCNYNMVILKISSRVDWSWEHLFYTQYKSLSKAVFQLFFEKSF